MFTKRIISTILAVFMLLSAFVIIAGAEDDTEKVALTYHTSNLTPTIDYLMGTYPIDGVDGEESTIKTIATPADKLAKMDLRLEKDGYRLYVDAYSGEVATYCIATGETLFSNPYNVGTDKAATSTKGALLSQIIIKYVDVITGQTYTMNSYTEAAARGQIVVKNIKNGLRVEYTMGREDARQLLPKCMEKNDFEEQILNILKEALGEDSYEFKVVKYGYTPMFPADVSGSALDTMYKNWPITKKMDVYVLNESYQKANKIKIEEYIKTYCTEFSYEDLEAAHLKTEYTSDESDPPLFKLALEYTLDEYGMSVRLPANGIRFNESLYQLYSLELLPYLGAGSNPNSGYTFFPDGSGTLFDFEKIAGYNTEKNYSGKYYGQDYAYHEDFIRNQEIIRYPVFGVVEEQEFFVGTDLTAPDFIISTTPIEDLTEAETGTGTDTGSETTKAETTTAETTTAETSGDETGTDTGTGEGEETDTENVIDETKTFIRNRGFVAIVEEGDALMEITTYHGGRTSGYNAVKMTVYPRPQDSYYVADSISIGEKDSKWTVVSSRKYTGNYKVRYVMLTDPTVAEECGVEDFYDCTYMGMALAYRDYLERNKILTPLTAADVEEGTPLYIEVFGAMLTTERVLSVPVDKMTPLTTFEDVATMYSDLSSKGIKNINFILTGFTDGGMTGDAVPYKLNWEKAVSKEMEFDELVADAEEKGYGLYPDFDFVFTDSDAAFDGLSLDKHAVKTIDGRYTSKREFSATKQSYISYFELALSPAYFSHFYEKLAENYLEYTSNGIAVSSLGYYLNSDFDEEEPYNREDSKSFTVKAFEFFDEKFDSVLTSGGNAYSWKYVDHITDIALDSSRILESSASVPFLGIVLHGYVQFAGEPINMEGNIEYAKLKTLENGANLNFILSYRNTENLKTSSYLSKYYSIRYDIWLDDIISIYDEVNEILADLQTSVIVDHKYINDKAQRIPDSDELEIDAKNSVLEAVENQKALDKATIEEDRTALLEARKSIIATSKGLAESQDEEIASSVADLLAIFEQTSFDFYDIDDGKLSDITSALNNLEKEKANLESAKENLEKAKNAVEDLADLLEEAEADKKVVDKIYNDACDALKTLYGDFKVGAQALSGFKSAVLSFNKATYTRDVAQAEYDALVAAGASNTKLNAAQKNLDEALEAYTKAETKYNQALTTLEESADNKNCPDSTGAKAAIQNIKNAMPASLAAYLDVQAKTAAVKANDKAIVDYETSIESIETVRIPTREKNIENAINNAIEFLTVDVYRDAAIIIHKATDLVTAYEKGLEDLKIFEERNIYTAEARADLKALLDDVKDEYELVKPIAEKVTKEVEDNYDKLLEFLPDDAEVEEFDIANFENIEEELEKEETEEGEEGDESTDGDESTGGEESDEDDKSDEDEKTEGEENLEEEEKPLFDPKYEVATNKIVYEVYSNGTALILNFNNYAVLVEIDGVSYSIGAYGYVVLHDVEI